MATAQIKLARYLLIINRLMNRKQAFKELDMYLQNQSAIRGYDCTISIRNFQKEIHVIRELFGVDICNNKSDHTYYINEVNGTLLDHQERIMESYALLDVLHAADAFPGMIHFETRKTKGLHHLRDLLHAIKNGLAIHTSHFHNPDGSVYERCLHPLALKESQERWYVLAEDVEKKRNGIYALDRILELEITQLKFEKRAMDINQWFKYSFGIMKPKNQHPEKIKLAFSSLQGQYIKSRPLHPSQTIEYENYDEDTVLVSLELFITDDFIMELMKYGNELIVLAPAALAAKIKDEHKKAYEQYIK